MDSLSRTNSFTIFSPNQPSDSPSFFCKLLSFARRHRTAHTALIDHLLRNCHANSRVYRHFKSSVYSQFDKLRFFPINCSKLSMASPFASSIFDSHNRCYFLPSRYDQTVASKDAVAESLLPMKPVTQTSVLRSFFKTWEVASELLECLSRLPVLAMNGWI